MWSPTLSTALSCVHSLIPTNHATIYFYDSYIKYNQRSGHRWFPLFTSNTHGIAKLKKVDNEASPENVSIKIHLIPPLQILLIALFLFRLPVWNTPNVSAQFCREKYRSERFGLISKTNQRRLEIRTKWKQQKQINWSFQVMKSWTYLLIPWDPHSSNSTELQEII